MAIKSLNGLEQLRSALSTAPAGIRSNMQDLSSWLASVVDVDSDAAVLLQTLEREVRCYLPTGHHLDHFCTIWPSNHNEMLPPCMCLHFVACTWYSRLPSYIHKVLSACRCCQEQHDRCARLGPKVCHAGKRTRVYAACICAMRTNEWSMTTFW